MTLILHCFHVYFAKRVFGIPAVFHIMGKQDLQLHDPSRRRLQQFMWKVACKADVLVVRGDRTREAFIRKGRFPADRIFVQQNVFDFRGYEPSKGPKDYDLVYVGYLAPYKHLHLLIEVVKQCAERGHAIHLALAGEGRLKTQIIHQAEQAGVIDQLHFLGTLDEPELIDALQRSRIFAMTSLGEGLPQAMIEALACGLPCVMFDDADIGQVITSGENGFLVPPGDTRAFTDAVIQLLDDVERYRRMSSNAAAIREQHSEQCSLYAQQKVWAKIVNTSLRT
jgi:glycosyltransferase involved in cell wall biosynthesis